MALDILEIEARLEAAEAVSKKDMSFDFLLTERLSDAAGKDLQPEIRALFAEAGQVITMLDNGLATERSYNKHSRQNIAALIEEVKRLREELEEEMKAHGYVADERDHLLMDLKEARDQNTYLLRQIAKKSKLLEQ